MLPLPSEPKRRRPAAVSEYSNEVLRPNEGFVKLALTLQMDAFRESETRFGRPRFGVGATRGSKVCALVPALETRLTHADHDVPSVERRIRGRAVASLVR